MNLKLKIAVIAARRKNRARIVRVYKIIHSSSLKTLIALRRGDTNSNVHMKSNPHLRIPGIIFLLGFFFVVKSLTDPVEPNVAPEATKQSYIANAVTRVINSPAPAKVSSVFSEKIEKKEKREDVEAIRKLERQGAYIQRFTTIAVGEQDKFGIPASIILAQGLLESDAGNSKLCKSSNNHFGIKCWGKEPSVRYRDKVEGSNDRYKVYENAWHSYRDHSEWLMSRHYRKLLKHGKDYRKWAHGLEACGYATDKNYGEKLIKMIDDFELYLIDDL